MAGHGKLIWPSSYPDHAPYFMGPVSAGPFFCARQFPINPFMSPLEKGERNVQRFPYPGHHGGVFIRRP